MKTPLQKSTKPFLALIALLASPRLHAAERPPSGPQFRVNSYTTGVQRGSSAALGGAGFVVTWQSLDQDGSGYGVFARNFGNGGSGGSEFRVNSYTSSDQSSARVAENQYGNFVVVGQSLSQDGDGSGIFAQRFENGTPSGDKFRVSTYATNDQSSPAVWSGGGSAFVVTWQSDHAGPGPDVFFEHFPGGTPIDGERRANTYTTGSQTEPSVAYWWGWTGIVTWTSNEDPDGSPGVYAQTYFDFPVELQTFEVE